MPSSTPQKKKITKKTNNTEKSPTIYTKCLRFLPLFKAVWIYIVRYVSYIYLLNPVYYVRQKEKILYYKDINGNITIKPRLKERIINLFLTERRLRSNILAWAKSKVPDQSIEDFSSSWQDGISLCALLESVSPGSCPGYRNLKTHNRVNNCRLGIKLGHQYLQIPSDMLTPEEMAIADKRTNRKIFSLISAIKWTSENKKVYEMEMGDDTVVQPNSCCTVQGSGLKAGVVGRKMKFSLNISNMFEIVDLFIQLKGPRNEVYSEKIVSLHQSSETILNNKNKITKRINPDKKIQTSEAKVLSYLEDGHGNTYVRWKNVKQYGAHAVYNVFDFNCTCNTEGSFSMSFTPVSAGIHTLSIRWQEQHVEGSPFKVKVYKLSDISRRGIADITDKRVLFDSLSMSVEGKHPSISLSDHSGTLDENKQGSSLEINTRREKNSLQRMRKQYTITKRRILKKVIARNGEEIIITETPTPPLSRQSSFSDHSDYTDKDGIAILKSRSRSSSPALLRAAKDLTEIRRQRSRSSSPSNDRRMKMLPGPSMAQISEKLQSPVPSSVTSSSLAVTDPDSSVSTESDKNESEASNGVANQISQKFLDSCLQSLGKQEYGFVRQNSDGAVPKSYRDGNKPSEKDASKLFVLSRSLSESSLENKILKRFYVCAQGNIMSRDDADLHSPLSSSGSLNLKLLHSGSLRKSCFYISQSAVNLTTSLASNDSRSDSSSGNEKQSNTPSIENSKETRNNVRPYFGNANGCSKTKMDETGDRIIPMEHSQQRSVTVLNNDPTCYTTNTPVALSARNQTELLAGKAYGKLNERVNLVNVLNINQSYEKCNIEKWLESQKRKADVSLENRSFNSSPIEKVPNRRTMSNDAVKEKTDTIKRSQSSDSRRVSLRKQSSVFPDTDSDPSLDDTHRSIKHIDDNILSHGNEYSCHTGTKHVDTDDNINMKYQHSSCCKYSSKETSSSQSYQTAVFRSIADGDANSVGQFSTRVVIVVPKVNCDKGTVVCAAEIKQETACYRTLLNYNVLRKRIRMLKTPTEISQQNMDPYGRPGRSLSVGACTAGISCLKTTISDRQTRDHNVRAWIEQNPHIRQGGPHRQSTVETIDSGMGDDNGIKTRRRASLYSHFRFPTDNQHQTVCRRPYKGQIRLDPKLVQSKDSSEIPSKNKERNEHSSGANTIMKDNTVVEMKQNLHLLTECDSIIADDISANIAEGRKKTQRVSWITSEDRTDISEPQNYEQLSKKTSSADSLQTLSTQLSQLTSSLPRIDDMYCGFGINRDARADLLSELNNFQNMDAEKLKTNEENDVQSEQVNQALSDEQCGNNTFSSVSPKSDRSSSYLVTTPSGEITDLEIDYSMDSLASPLPEPRYISSIECPFYRQVNDVIIAEDDNDVYSTKDILDDDTENENVSTFSLEDSCCKADGTGLIQGHVGMKNNFQVWTNDPENGSLSVAIYGPKSHSVLETCIVYTGDNLYEVMYEVKHPGIYIICVKWSEQNIPNSPFTSRVTY